MTAREITITVKMDDAHARVQVEEPNRPASQQAYGNTLPDLVAKALHNHLNDVDPPSSDEEALK